MTVGGAGAGGARVCPHCGFGAPAAAAECPLCRTPLASTAPPPAARPIPWEDPARSFPGNLAASVRESMLEPGRFFARVPWEGRLARPVLYLLLLTVFSAFFTFLWGAAGLQRGGMEAPPGLAELNEGALLLLNFTLSPFVALAGLLVSTLVLHVFALALARERRGMAATARAVCYASGPAVLAVVPVLGPLAAFVWSVVLLVLGVREAHRTTVGRAAAIVFVPALILAGLLVGLVILAVLLAGRLPLPGGQLPVP